MKKSLLFVLMVAFLAGAFLAGSYYGRSGAFAPEAAAARLPLYYHDPMHPAYRSDKPGIAPDCGMQLEPVYAEEQGAQAARPGAVNISPEKQQIIGVEIGTVEMSPVRHTLRVFGRVAPDERRIYRLNSGVEGLVQELSDITTGAYVAKNQWLATFYAPDFRQAIQGYLFSLDALDRLQRSRSENESEIALSQSTARLAVDKLRNLGMPAAQVEEIRRTRQIAENVKILSPVDGFVLSRNLSPGEKFEKGTECYRIADLSRVWVLADVFQNEAELYRPGMQADVWLPDQNKSFKARVSEVPPQFDPSTRTLKVRLEVENLGYVLRPDMFVDVTASVELPPAISVPADAVLDSGMAQHVFVEQGKGFFERRAVQIGSRYGDRAQVLSGLTPGERIVISGTFLVDSETRLKSAAATSAAATTAGGTKDPACGMQVDEAAALAAGKVSRHAGKAYYFCSNTCKADFEKKIAAATPN
jgi:RND family efflux transporter MFP subunit